MEDQILYLAREALLLSLMLSLPPVLAALVASLVTAGFQGTTQIQDATLSQVPRMLAALGGFAVALPWISEQTVNFTHAVLVTLPLAAR